MTDHDDELAKWKARVRELAEKWPLPTVLSDETLDPPPSDFEMAMAKPLAQVLERAEERLRYPLHVTIESSDGRGTEWLDPERGAVPTLLLEYSHDPDGPAVPLVVMIEVREYDAATGQKGEQAFCGKVVVEPLPIN